MRRVKTFNQLIRLHRHRLHERQKVLTKIEAEAGELQHKRDALEAEALIEEARAEESQFGIMAFAKYFARVKDRRNLLADAHLALDQKLVAARADLKAVFEELKRIEILRDQKVVEAAAAEKKAEQLALDEVAINQHRRRESA